MSVFSPLALTQTLPFLPLAQGDIDYEVARRGEPDLFAKVLAEPATKVILVKDGKVAVPHGQGAIADYANVKMRLAQLPGAYVAAELESHPSALAIFLGSYGGRLGEHVVAVDVTHVQPNDTTITAATARSGERTTRSPKCRRMNRRKTRNRCWKARQPDSTGWTCADSHPTPAHAKPDRQPPPSRSACGTPGSVTARRAARPSNRRSAAGLSTARTMRMAIVCCSPNRTRGDHRDRRP